MRRKRYYRSRGVYSLTFRTRQGLPFVCNKTVNLLIESAIARAQRDNKLSICHDLWMTNHAHFITVFYDMYQAQKFHMEVKKKITDYFKRLLGLEKLNLWEDDDSVIEILDLQAVQSQIAYLYNNPIRENMVDSIDEYQGVNSWSSFIDCKSTLLAKSEKTVPWIRQPSIKPLKTRKLSKAYDTKYSDDLKNKARLSHKLIREPNAWMKVFGITTDELVEKTNNQILFYVRGVEKELREKRVKPVSGINFLYSREITIQGHKPKKNDSRVFVISSNKEARIDYIKMVKDVFNYCRELYQKACSGVVVSWPPGVFPAQHRPLCSALIC